MFSATYTCVGMDTWSRVGGAGVCGQVKALPYPVYHHCVVAQAHNAKLCALCESVLNSTTSISYSDRVKYRHMPFKRLGR